MKTVLEVVQLSAQFLKEKGIESGKREAEWVIADCLGLKRLDLYLQYDRPLNELELASCREAIKRRGQREPVAYIAGKVTFAGCTLAVDKRVLIPRPETEILVEKISQTLEKQDMSGKILWDMCTGSGCIGIALKKRFPLLQVVLSDISKEALSLAALNAKNNQVDVELVQGDLFAPFAGKRCDFFVSNPPYVATHEWPSLQQEVNRYEPQMAFVAGEDGLTFYRQIAADLKKYLNSQAWFELGSGQGESVLSLFQGYGKCSLERDWARHDRYLSIVLEKD